jgi:hypothetical protein
VKAIVGEPDLVDLQYWHVEAMRYEGKLPTGRTVPLTLGCVGELRTCKATGGNDVSPDTEKDFVVKVCGCDDMTDKGRTYEFIALLLGQALSVPAVEPAIVKFPLELIPMLPEPKKTALMASNDRQFGSRHLGSGWTTYPNGKVLEDCLINQALCIYVFDLLIQNVDRRLEKPNVLTNGTELRAYDHEKAFTFLVPLLRERYAPWQIRQYDWARNHIFYKSLKGRKLDIDSSVDKIASLEDIVFNRIWELLPKEWTSSELGSIEAHIRNVKDNVDLFSAELKEVLA